MKKENFVCVRILDKHLAQLKKGEQVRILARTRMDEKIRVYLIRKEIEYGNCSG
tara:strand:+ start:1482 stop:1643 length:162 start_codon:yes stop_codon:yes gene_type:complete